MYGGVRARLAPWLLAGFGLVLTGMAAGWHLGIETQRLGQLGGPALAFGLDGLLPLVLVYGSYRLVSSSTPGEQIWTVFVWSVVGSVAVGAIIGLSILIRMMEGRTIAEPVFVTLLAIETGAVTGLVAGTLAVRARQDASRASRTASTLSFVNDLFRHDISNGLVVIDGRATIIQRNADSEVVQTAADAIHEQVTELDSLVGNAGAVAETLGPDPAFEPIDTVAIAETVIQRLEQTHTVAIDLQAPDSAMVYANEAARPALRNLLENAIEHGTPAAELSAEGTATDGSALREDKRGTDTTRPTADGHNRPSVLVSIRTSDDTVEIHVVDDGPGIPDGQRDSIFDPRAGETHGGGLHLVQTLVESFGGDIALADGADTAVLDTDFDGAHFVVELPKA
ncbi:histidine kinase [Haloarcula sp. CBA1130]|uniref:ATP-binding protein n=1 Tax=unclassified Haloarcula TaxID=2624677 RepID=UPI001246A87A|nr:MULTISPECIES: ATP-binding protein [unclassified Haloarcula]KAA9399726.1 histidine kinase [Haloarcula sp. CBA1129]KAA9401421.1 histidine kinase [Haloarcula sp. CBA1130]